MTINQRLFTVNFEPSLPLKDNKLMIEDDLLDEVSLYDDTKSISDSSDTTTDNEDEGSSHIEYDQSSSVINCGMYNRLHHVRRKKVVTFQEPLVTSVRLVRRASLKEKCLLYYTDEDMAR